jgi:hypothetical protein
MSEPQAPQSLPPEMLSALLQTVRRRQQQGDQVGARVVLRALAKQYNDVRLWLALATVAANRQEQRQAIEQALALDPENALVQQALAALNNGSSPVERRQAAVTPMFGTPNSVTSTTTSLVSPDAPTQPMEIEAANASTEPMQLGVTTSGAAMHSPPTLMPLDEEREHARTIRWPLYALIAISVLVVLGAALFINRSSNGPSVQPTPTVPLPGAFVTQQPLATPTAQPEQTQAPAPTTAPEPSVTPRVTPSATPTATIPPTPPALPIGEIMVNGQWQATLLQPDHAVILDGAIGSLQPRGRFVLVLIAISNSGANPSRIPDTLFTLRDAMGNSYPALADASTTYLDTYGRGQRGDLSSAEEIPAGGGLVSVPLIFDVPETSRKLSLHMGNEPLGWPIGDSNAQ